MKFNICRGSAKRLGNSWQMLVWVRSLRQGAQHIECFHQFFRSTSHPLERFFSDGYRRGFGAQLWLDLVQDVFNEVSPEHRKFMRYRTIERLVALD